MKEHERLSGKEIHQHLKDNEIYCCDKTVYHHLRIFKKEGKITQVARVDRRGATEKYYSWIEQDEDLVKRQLISDIQDIFGIVGIIVKKKFENKAMKSKAYVLRVFRRELWNATVAEDKHDYSTWQLWNDFFDLINDQGFSKLVSEFSHGNSEITKERIKEILENHQISPALLAFIRFFKNKKTVSFVNEDERPTT